MVNGMSGSPKWRRRKEARPQELLEAALDVFAEKGFNAARVEEIAERAGVSKGTVYLYFDTKEAVFRSLVRENLRARITPLRESVLHFEGPSRELIALVLSTIANVIVNSKLAALPKIIIAESGNFPQLAEFYRREVIDVGLGVLRSIVERGIARGEFRAIDPDHAARLCIAPMLLAMVWKVSFAQFDQTPFDVEAFAKTHLDVLLKGLNAGPGEAA
jgi:AcrR family transcriptional regulator